MIKLVILPHAGSGAHAYRNLQNTLGPTMNSYCHDLPGHGKRASEPLVESMQPLVSDLMQQLDFLGDEPWAIFGHSLGAWLGHALVLEREALGLSLPVVFFASGASAPKEHVQQQISALPTEPFWEKIRAYGLLPAEILNDQGFREYFEVLLRNDFSVVESYRPALSPLNVPLHILYGQEDMSDHQAESWCEASLKEVQRHPFDGGHFFLFDHLDGVSQLIQAVLSSVTDKHSQAT